MAASSLTVTLRVRILIFLWFRYIHGCVFSQVILLSATMPDEVLEVTKRFMRDPIQILVKKEELTLEGIRQFYIQVEKEVNHSLIFILSDCRLTSGPYFSLLFDPEPYFSLLFDPEPYFLIQSPTFPYFLIQSPNFPYFLTKQPNYPYFLGCHVVKLNKEHLKHVFLHWFST